MFVGGAWPLVGRDAELDRIAGLVRRGTGGLVIAGPSGVGRSRLGAEAMALAEVKGAAVAQVAGTRALSSIPLGVFAPLLPGAEIDAQRRADNRPELLHRCREALRAMAGDRRLVLLVDDAHLIDDVSASLLHQLVAASWIYVIATVDTDSEPTEATILLWKDDGVDRIDLAGLDLPAIDGLLVSVLGGPVDPAATRALAAAAQGSVVYFRELVRSAVDAGTFHDDIGVWRLRGPLPSSTRLAELVQVRLEGLSEPQRELLELLAFGEPLTVGEIPDLDLSTLEELERRALIRVRLDGRRTEVRLAHAIYGQVVRDRMPMLRARAVARLLGDAIEATGMRRRDDLLRVATWRLDGGGSRPELMLEAADVARSRFDFALAERLARRAVHIGAGFDAAFLAAQVTAHQGRREEAEDELLALERSATSDRERGLVAAARLDNFVFTMGHVDRGLAMAAAAEETIQDPVWRLEITAKRSSVLGGVQGPRAALDVALPVLDQAQGGALVWASLVSSWGLGRLGRLESSHAVSESGHAAYLELEEPPDWRASRLVFFQAEALAQLGRMQEATRLSEQMYEAALEDGSLEDQAWFAWQLSRSAVDRGNAETAANYGRLAVALFRQLGAPQYEQFALVDLAAAFAIGGHQRESRETLAFMDALGIAGGNYFRVNVLQARGWTAVTHGDLPAATEHLRQGTTVGVEIGDLLGAAGCAHGIARLGTPGEALPTLEQLAGEIEGPLMVARLDHVRALTVRDATALEEVAARFDSFGATLLAAEAAADAAIAWRDEGSPRRAAAAHRLASSLADRCERPATPALSETRRAARLTPAERTAALLAANGRTSRQIAEELVVSVRTVENHLQHVYEKLGIRGRAELRAVEGLSER